MHKEDGFSLVELLVVIFISTTVVVPLLFSLVNNLETNVRFINRSAASQLAETTFQGFQTMNYTNLRSHNDLDTSTGGPGYIEFNKNQYCSAGTFTPYPNNNEAICHELMNAMANNVTFDETQFRVFVYPHYITEAEINNLLNDLTIPEEIREYISELTPTTNPPDVAPLLNISIFIQYDSRDQDVFTRHGVLSRD